MRLILTLIVLISEFSGLWAATNCPLKDKAKEESDYFIVQHNDIDETIKSFNKLKDDTNELDHFGETIDYVVGDLEHLKKISKKSFIDVNNVNIDCDNMIDVREGLRKMNVFREKHLQPTATMYKDLLDCYRSEDRINCRFAFERIYLSPDVVIATDQAADVDTLKVNHSDLFELYNESNRLFADVSLMIMWFRTYGLIDVDSSETSVPHFEPVESELLNVKSKMNDALRSMHNISANIGNANSSKPVDETSKMLADVNSSLFQLREVHKFLTTSNDTLTGLQQEVQNRQNSKMSLSTELEFEYSYRGKLTLREQISSLQIATNKNIKSLERNPPKIERVMRHAGRNMNSGSKRYMSYEIITNSMIEFNANAVSYHLCYKEVIDAIRSLALSKTNIKISKPEGYFRTSLTWSWMRRQETVDNDLDTLTIRYVLEHNKQFVIFLKEQSDSQKNYLIEEMEDYLNDLDESKQIENPLSESTMRNEEQRDNMTEYLRRFNAVLAELMNSQCNMSKAIINAIWIKYLETLGGPFETMYDNDDVVQTLLNEQSESSLSSFLTSKIESWMWQLQRVLNNFVKAAERHQATRKGKHEPDGYRIGTVDLISFYLGKTEREISELGLTSTEFYSEVAHAARIGMETSLFDLEETFVVHMDEDENEAVGLGEYNSQIADDYNRQPLITGLFGTNRETLVRVNNEKKFKRIVAQYTEQAPKNIYALRDHRFLFEYESCGNHCVIVFEVTDMADAEIAVIFGTILENDDGQHRAIMYFTQTVGPITSDKKEILARINNFSELDFYYLDKYHTAQEPLHVELTDRRPLSLFIAVGGRASFSFKTVDAVILGPSLLGSNDDHERQRHPSYKHFQFNTSDEIETNYYAMRGSEPEIGDEEEYYSVPVNSEHVCSAIGLVFNHVDKFGKITQKAYYYNGRHVVYNPNYACFNKDYHADPSYVVDNNDDIQDIHFDNAIDAGGLHVGYSVDQPQRDQLVFGSTGDNGLSYSDSSADEEKRLNMSFRYAVDEDSNLILEAKFFTTGADFYYSLSTPVEAKFVPGYIYQKLVSTDVETSFQIRKEDSPFELPGHENRTCRHVSECHRLTTNRPRLTCDFGGSGNSEGRLGVCAAAHRP